jgi:sugar/nucleoside kinase (ribokinase family)
MGGAGAEFQGEIYPVEPVEVRDSSGAGDAFMATLVAGFLRSGDLISSIREANTAAAQVVTKRGVTVVEP